MVNKQLLDLISILKGSCTNESPDGDDHAHSLFDQVDEDKLNKLIARIGTPHPPTIKWAVYDLQHIDDGTGAVLMLESIWSTEDLADGHCETLAEWAKVIPFTDYTL